MDRSDKRRRFLIALNDLAESKDQIEAYIAFTDTPAYLDAYGALGVEMAERMKGALLSSGFISYARPFVQSRGSGWTKVPDSFTASFTRQERQIHKYVLEARQKLIAHSDLEGVHTDIVETNSGDVIWSVRPVPIVMIRGEADSVNVRRASERSKSSADVTLDQVREIVEDAESHEGTTNVVLREHRMFDVDVGICSELVVMIDKVDEAISLELGM